MNDIYSSDTKNVSCALEQLFIPYKLEYAQKIQYVYYRCILLWMKLVILYCRCSLYGVVARVCQALRKSKNKQKLLWRMLITPCQLHNRKLCSDHALYLGNFSKCIQCSCCVCFILQEEVVKKKYGGLMPKKPPLISKVA